MNARLHIQEKLRAVTAFSLTCTRTGLLQRKCACGGSAGAFGECEECRKKDETGLQRSPPPSKGKGRGESETVPPIVHEVLRSPGQPLDSATRAFFEPRFGHDFSQVRVQGRAGMAMQPKLVIGEPGDRYEQEADAIAEQVMRMPDSSAPEAMVSGHVSRLRSGESPAERDRSVQRQTWNPYSIEEGLTVEGEEEKEAESVQAKEAPGRQLVMTPEVAAQIETLRAGGEPLPTPLRTFMETRFGHDFSKVRVHTGGAAAETAALVNARAFTIGRALVFGVGQYAPESVAGRRLIAHELTHVVQQGEAPRLSMSRTQVGVHGMGAQAGAHGLGMRDSLISSPITPGAAQDLQVIRRVKWYPNKATGKTSSPWCGGGPSGVVLKAATDAGTPLDIWRPYDGKTYWCHGYTFGGSSAKGGPYSLWGSDVPTVLKDDGWKQTYSCMARPADILIFWDKKGILTHSGIIRKVSSPGGQVDDAASTLESKWGNGPHNTSSWETNAKGYGKYRCYSKSPLTGVCSGKGTNEL